MRKICIIVIFFIISAAVVQSQVKFSTGSQCLAFWEKNGLFYAGTIVESVGSNYRIVYADGDQAVVSADKIKPFDLKVGSKVLAMWSDKKLYAGTVTKIVGGAFFIHFDDGDEGWTSLAGIAIKY